MFIKYCVFLEEFSKVCNLSFASTRLLLVVQPIGVTVHSHGVDSFEGCGRGRGCSELKKTQFFLNTLYLANDKTFFLLFFEICKIARKELSKNIHSLLCNLMNVCLHVVSILSILTMKMFKVLNYAMII